MKVTIVKLEDSKNPKNPGHTETGHSVTGTIHALPTVGERFSVHVPGDIFTTSPVQELLTISSFRTENSVYKLMDVFEEPQTTEQELEHELQESDVHQPQNRVDTSKGGVAV